MAAVYTSLYGQVNWNGFSIALPEEIVKAWENRTMNVVGYEFDAIRCAPTSIGGLSICYPLPVPVKTPVKVEGVQQIDDRVRGCSTLTWCH